MSTPQPITRYQSIQSRIYEIRGQRVMLDYDLAFLYEVETRVLNQAVKRNLERFPEDFMFRLRPEEYEVLFNQINQGWSDPSSQIVMMKSLPLNRGDKYLPYAFTEQGVAMLSGVLHSKKAVSMNIAIMRAFVEVRRSLLMQMNIKDQLKEIKEKLGEHDEQLNQLYEAMENLIDDRIAQNKWNERNRIGFKI